MSAVYTAVGAGSLIGGYLSGQGGSDAAEKAANAQVDAARIAAETSQFRPVGMTTNFGKSNFQYDPSGKLVSSGYNLNPQLQAQQDQLMGMNPQMLSQYQNSMGATAPMGQAAQGMMGLGNKYLSTSPQDQAAKYMQDQMAILQPQRDVQLANLQNQLQQSGRGGLSIAQGSGMMSANPEMAAYYNSLQNQNNQLAAQATQGGMDYAKFGADLSGKGGNMLQAMYGAQSAAAQPYQTNLGLMQSLEGMGQQPLDLATAMAAKQSTAGANVGNAIMTGASNATPYRYAAGSYSPLGSALTGASGMMGNYMNREVPWYQQQPEQQPQPRQQSQSGWI